MKSTDKSVKEREINLEDAGGGNKKNKQWLRFGATSLLIAIGMGANTGGEVSAAEDPTIDDADASLASKILKTVIRTVMGWTMKLENQCLPIQVIRSQS